MLTFVGGHQSREGALRPHASFFGDKIPGGLMARSGADGISSTERFALVQSMKVANAAIQGPAALVASVPGLILDAAQFLLQAGFAKYCEKWEGPIKATFIGESFTRQGEPFFDYTIELEGKVMLLYGKSAPAGAPVKLKGYIDGTGRFDVRDNPKPIVRLVPGQVLFHRVTSPPGGSYWDDLGMATRSMLPYGFRVPVTGIMAGDSILLTVEAAANDFSDGSRASPPGFILPLGAPVPQVLNVPMSLQKAQPIIERVVRRHPVLKIAHRGSDDGAGTFSRDTTNADKTRQVRTTDDQGVQPRLRSFRSPREEAVTVRARPVGVVHRAAVPAGARCTDFPDRIRQGHAAGVRELAGTGADYEAILTILRSDSAEGQCDSPGTGARRAEWKFTSAWYRRVNGVSLLLLLRLRERRAPVPWHDPAMLSTALLRDIKVADPPTPWS
jgi:hypothetical protein